MLPYFTPLSVAIDGGAASSDGDDVDVAVFVCCAVALSSVIAIFYAVVVCIYIAFSVCYFLLLFLVYNAKLQFVLVFAAPLDQQLSNTR